MHLRAAIIALALTTTLAHAAPRLFPGVASKQLGQLERDDHRSRLYVNDVGHEELLVLDSANEAVVTKLPAPGVQAFAIDMEGKRLAMVGGATITFVDLDTLGTRSVTVDPMPNEEALQTVAFDDRGRVYVGTRYVPPSGKHDNLMRVNADTGLVELTFGGHVNWPLLRTDPTGMTLFCGETNASPNTMRTFDVSGDEPTLLFQSPFGALGGILSDFAPYKYEGKVFVSAGSPYGVQVVSNTLEPISIWSTGAYGQDVALDGDQEAVFALAHEHVYKFNANDGQPLGIYRLPTNHSACQVAADRPGLKAFVTTRSQPYDADDCAKIVVLDTQSTK